jgi:class 3 adenylate cyclase
VLAIVLQAMERVLGFEHSMIARLCAEAQAGHILLSARVASAVEDLVQVDEIGALALKGFARAVPAFRLAGLRT